MIGNAFMASVPGHPLWKWLIPQTIKRYYADRAQKDEKDATKISTDAKRPISAATGRLMLSWLR